MIITSQTYKTLRRQAGACYEIQVEQGGRTYGMDRLSSVQIFPTLAGRNNGIVIGNACSTQCELVLLEKASNWARMGEFTVKLRLKSADGTQESEWLNMGTYYTDTRTENEYGMLTIVAFDRMLMTERFWVDAVSNLPDNFPITSKAWCDLAEAAGLIELDSRTQVDDTVAFIGLDTSRTAREVLQDIAAANAGNWIITGDNKFRLVPYASMVDGSAAIAGIAIAGISVVGDANITIDSGADYAYLGMDVEKFSKSPVLPGVTGVNLEADNGDVTAAGTAAGTVVYAGCNFAATEGLASLCLSKLSGYAYKPFEAVNALLDPAAEVGDLVIINGKSYQMTSIEWTLNRWAIATISAPYEAEVDSEYKMATQEQKTLRKASTATDGKLLLYPTTIEMNSAIQQTASSITSTVAQNYVLINDYQTAIANLQEQIDGSISSFSGEDVPTLSNYPANEWTTQSEKEQHVGSLYLVTADSQSGYAGQYYRFEQNGSSFAWVLIEDSALATALAKAAQAQAAAEAAQQDADTAQAAADAAQDTADQARLEAVAQAAQAQAVAITQAAIDATNKANQALAEAKAYANQQVTDFINGEYADDLAAVQAQLDQKIETYYQAADPSQSWGGNDHTGDLWYNTGNQLYYRWNGTAWEELTSNPPQGVFDKIDGKARIFISQPTPPYDVGDMWTQGANGDILRCETARGEGEQYHRDDWGLASKYTDDSALAQFLRGEFAETIQALKEQLDQKAETFYQADEPSGGGKKWDTIAGRAIVGVAIVGSTLELHIGDMWYRTTDDKTFRWNGTAWEEQTISREVFDTIDGKAQIFVGSNNPTPPYARGDLWFVDDTSEILTCITDRAASEGFSRDDWEKYNKYTDDSYAEAVETDLHTNYYTRRETDSEINQKADEITLTVTSNVISENELELPYGGSYGAGRTYNFDSSLTMKIEPDGTITLNGISSETRTLYLASREERLPLYIGTFICGGHASAEEVISFRVYHYNSETNTTTAIGDWFDAAGSHTFGWGWPLEFVLLAMRIPAEYEFEDFTLQPQIEYGRTLHGWQPPAMSTKSQIKVNTDQIYASVVSKSGGSQQSFGWALTDSDWSLYANGNRVFRASESGIEITGSGTFTGVVNATGGTFTGAVTAQNLTITGGDINLGNGAFHVTNGGAVTASNMQITGGQISISNGESSVFSVSSSGALTATNANITGAINATSGTFSGNLNSAGGSFAGELRGATGTFSGSLSAARGTFAGELQAATGTFGGTLSAARGSFSGDISGASGTFTGNLSGSTITGSTITGGSISIGNGAFVVDSSGNLTATSGRFTGEVLAKNIQAGGSAGYIQGSMIQTSTITGSLIAPTTITGANIQSGTITGAKIDSGTITGANIQQGTITGSKIDSGTITGANIQQSTITGSLIAPKTIGAAQITDKSIQAALIADGSITTDLIEEACITTDLIAEEAITEDLLGEGAVTNNKIQSSTITGSKIAPSTITGGDGGNIAQSTITGGDGGNIARNTITGGTSGNISGSTIKEFNVPGGEFSGSSLSSSINQSISYANNYNSATQNGTGSYPPYFTAGKLISIGDVIADEIQIRASASGESGTTLSNHYHTIHVNDDGTVTFGMPYNTNTPPSFRVADTKAYKDGVSAITASSIHYEQGEEGSLDYNSIFVHLSSSKDPTYSKNVTGFDNSDAVDYGKDTGIKTTNATAMSVSAVNAPTQDEDGYWISQATGTVTIGATLSDGSSYSKNVEFQGRNINVTAAYNAGKSSARITDIAEDTSRTKTYGNGVMNIPVKATLATAGSEPFADMLENVDVSLAVNAGHDAGAKTAFVDGQYFDISSSPFQFNSLTGMAKVHVNAYASSTLSNGNTYTNARPTLSSDFTLDCTNIYNQGKTDGAGSVSVDEITVYSQSYSNKEYNLRLRAFSNGVVRGTDTASLIPTAAWNDAQNNVSVSSLSIGTSRGAISELGLSDVWGDPSTGIIHLYVPERVQVTKTSISGQSNSQWVTDTSDVQITPIWAEAASQGIATGRNDAIDGLSMNSNNISYPTILGNSYPVGSQRFVNFTASASVNGTTYSDGRTRNVSTSRTESMNVTAIYNQGLEQGGLDVWVDYSNVLEGGKSKLYIYKGDYCVLKFGTSGSYIILEEDRR